MEEKIERKEEEEDDMRSGEHKMLTAASSPLCGSAAVLKGLAVVYCCRWYNI